MNRNILAIDFGRRAVGLAVYFWEVGVVLPGESLIGKKLEEVIEKIVELVVGKRIDLILIGEPMREMRDEVESKLLVKIGEFRDLLLKKFEKVGVEVEIELVDEGFTSFQAESLLRDYGLHLKEEKEKVHGIAAKFILERYLNS